MERSDVRRRRRGDRYLPEERRWIGRFLKTGYVDGWRRLNPDRTEVYSWWSFRFDARRKNIGWRLDYLVVDEDTWPRVRGADILCDVEGSDHCPVTLDLED